MTRPRLLHLHSTFNLGGKEARAVQLMNAFGDRFEHDIVSAMPDQVAAFDLIDRSVTARLLADFPPLGGRWTPARLRRIGAAIAAGGHDLVLTYNFGAMDAVMANRLFARRPHVHHEDGFNEDEAVRQKRARILYRRLALGATARLVVPSRNLERIALSDWHQPRGRVTYVPNGIDMARFGTPPAPDAIVGLTRRDGEVIVGTLAGLRPVKNLPRLVRAFAVASRAAPDVAARLVIAGSGPEEAVIRAEAARLGIGDRLVMPGFLAHPHLYVGLFDVFALSSDSEQFPISLVEAMAAGLPAASVAVGDIAEIVAEPNCALLAPPGDEAALAAALARLIADPSLRETVGKANRSRVAALYSEGAMVAAYSDIYQSAMRGGLASPAERAMAAP